MVDIKSKNEEIEKFINELKILRNRKFNSSDNKQELYVQIANKLGNLLFSIERVENNKHYQSNAYYEDVLLDIKEIEDLEIKYPNEWTNALKKTVGMYLNTALRSIDNFNQQDKDFFINQAIYTLWFCKNKNDLKVNYYNKIEQ